MEQKPSGLRRIPVFYYILGVVFVAILCAVAMFWGTVGATLNTYNFWKTFASPIATAMAAIVAARITYKFGRVQAVIAQQQADVAAQQAELADIRLRHDLFDRRFEIYEIVFLFLIEIMQTSNISDEGLKKFVRGTGKAVFVFNQAITDYLEELRKSANNLKRAASIVGDRNIPVGPERTAAAQKQSDLFMWFTEQFAVLIDLLKPFMALDNTRRPAIPPVAAT